MNPDEMLGRTGFVTLREGALSLDVEVTILGYRNRFGSVDFRVRVNENQTIGWIVEYKVKMYKRERIEK